MNLKIALACFLLLGAFGLDEAFSQGPPLLVPQPGPTNTVLRIFQKPFAGDYSLSNFFDHNLPFEFNTAPGIANDFQLTWWGERTFGIDGHTGYDWPMPEGTPLLAVADGTIVFAGQQAAFFCPLLNAVTTSVMISIDHGQLTPDQPAIRSRYFHMSRIDVVPGQHVTAGQQIGLAGNVGCSSEPHLHFEALRFVPSTGNFSLIDPYGWEGTDPDPWAQHPQGTQSLWLWKDGQVPAIFREVRLAPNPNGSTAAVTITTFRHMGWKDDEHPSNEFIEITLDSRFAPSGSFDLTGFSLRNNQGDVFNFPSNFILHDGSPVRVFSGSGADTSTELYWNQSRGMWNNMGDCARRLNTTGAIYFVGPTGPGTCGIAPSSDAGIAVTTSPNAITVGQVITYTTSLFSNGPDNSKGVVLTTTLPGGVTLQSTAASQGGCFGTATIICNLGTITSGARGTVMISVIPSQTATITNTFQVMANQTDPNLSNNSVSITLLPDTTSSTPSISISDAVVTEGNSGTVNATFQVTLSMPSSHPITVTFSTANRTATAGVDYVSASGTLIFEPGQTTKSFTIVIDSNETLEFDKTFVVNLTSATDAIIFDGQGIGTILNDDGPLPKTLANISTRGAVLTGDNVMIGGFIIDGSAPKRVLIRSRGPSMAGAPFFVPGTLANPLVRLFSGSAVIAQNDNWQDLPNCSGFVCGGATEIVNTGFDPCTPNPGQTTSPPNCTLEAAILITLPPGAYTAIVTGADTSTGVGLVEVFEADAITVSDLGNISTRGFVQSGDGVMIGGLIIEGSAPATVLIRARGPSMSGAPFFVPGTLADPFLQLFSGQNVIAQNNNWQNVPSCSGFVCGTAAQIAATGLDPCQPNPAQTTPPPSCTLESAILITLPPGAYTAIVSGVGGGTGVGLIEAFEMD
jgi:uncharacterized repeat protein (TIGR01451 family)